MQASFFMQRCFDLAQLGAGKAAPNPMVGAVLVYNDRIIGEGYYAQDGGPHAEVMAVASVAQKDKHLIDKSCIYVSLEPCNIYGRTPPCVNLILDSKIPKVVIASRDLTPGVNGEGLERLRQAGVEVIENLMPAAGQILSRYRNVYISEHRPYTVLKYAQTQNGFIAPTDGSQEWLTNSFSKRLVHKWRTETDAILIGIGTARADNPALTARLYPGKQPLRLLIDRHHSLPADSQLLDGTHPTWVFTQNTYPDRANIRYIEHDFESSTWLSQLLQKLGKEKIAHLTVEGGAWLLEQFTNNNLWDEARVFTSKHEWTSGLRAPTLGVAAANKQQLSNDMLSIYYHPKFNV